MGKLAIIDVKSLRKSFGQTEVLCGLNLSISEGEFVCLLGLSGAGKTTFLRCLNGLNDFGDGSIDVANFSPASGNDLRALRRQVGMIFQHFNLVGRLSAIDNVLTGISARLPFWRSMLGIYRTEDVEKAKHCLERVGLVEKAYRRADTLSGGEKQRVAIARALIQEPKVILADEPISSVDPKVGGQIMELLQKIAVEDGITVVCNIHNVEFARKYAQRIIGMAQGQIVFDGAPDQLMESDTNKIYLVEEDAAPGDRLETRHAEDQADVAPDRPGAVMPVESKSWLSIRYVLFGIAAIAILSWSAVGTELSIYTLGTGIPHILDFISRMFPPDIEKLPSLADPVVETLQIAIWGTLLGILFALPLGLFGARNITPHASVYWIARGFLNLGRGVSELVFALIFVSAVGLGPFPGVLALAVHNAGMLGKFYADSIESVDPGPIDALYSTGASKLRMIRWAILPQILPDFISFNLYRFEVSVRAATVLGLVGAGGIGFPLLTSLRLFRYDETTTILILVVLMVAATDLVASYLRKRII